LFLDLFVLTAQFLELVHPLLQSKTADFGDDDRAIQPVHSFARPEIEIPVTFGQPGAMAQPLELLINGLQIQHCGFR